MPRKRYPSDFNIAMQTFFPPVCIPGDFLTLRQEIKCLVMLGDVSGTVVRAHDLEERGSELFSARLPN